MSKALESKISVEIIHPDQWPRLRVLRLKSLQVNPEAFGGTYEIESAESESELRAKFEKLNFLVATVDGVDAAMMSVEELVGDFGATCWIGGCWSDPSYRGKGLLRALFDFVDQQDRDWKIQGLGVWIDNYSAIAAYEKLGFVKMGEDTPSTRQPGKFHQRMIRKSEN